MNSFDRITEFCRMNRRKKLTLLVSGRLGLVAMTLAALILPAHAQAQGDYDLLAAIAAAQAGDVLHVPAGVYAGPVVIDKPLTLIGEDRPTIQATGQAMSLRSRPQM